MKFEISKMMTLSNAHVTQDTYDKLLEKDGTDEFPLAVYKKEDYGVFIYIDENTSMKEYKKNCPKDLYDCIFVAHKHDCPILCLDCDGPIMDSLRTYTW